MENNILDLLLFPEFIFLIGIIVILLIGLFKTKNIFSTTSNLSVILLIVVGIIIFINKNTTLAYFNNFFNESSFISFFQILIIIGSISTIIISSNYFKDLKLLRFEIPILILFSTLGMLVLIGSNNLMSMYLGIELQSLSLYVLAAIKRDSLQSAEAGIKFFVLGALSSGILLYGSSLIYGFTGSTNFNDIFTSISSLENLNLGIIFGLVFILVGLAFKVSAVPFHMWTPDVYEGAPTSVTAFFAIVPKVASVALIYRFCLEPFANFYKEWSQIIIFLSIASMFWGAIAAIAQTNIKRLRAYSSIGHIGYVLIGLASFNVAGVKGSVIYMLIYVLMNIAIFAVILSLKLKDNYIEKISDLSGLSRAKPIFSICIAITMLSMAGIPPLAGFFGKFYIFIAAIEAKLFYLAVLGVLSSVISAFYYLRIIKVMYFDDLEISDYQSNISTKASLILFFTMLVITMFILYPTLIINIGTNVSIDFFNN